MKNMEDSNYQGHVLREYKSYGLARRSLRWLKSMPKGIELEIHEKAIIAWAYDDDDEAQAWLERYASRAKEYEKFKARGYKPLPGWGE